MPENPYSKQHNQQFRGPSDSGAFNETSENNYRDLVYLYNKANEIDVDMSAKYSAVMKDTYSLSQEIEAIRLELASLSPSSEVHYTSPSQKDDSRFDGGSYEVTAPLSFDGRFGTYGLPKIDAFSISRLTFTNAEGDSDVPASLNMVVEVEGASVEADADVEVSTSSIYEAVINKAGSVWERNVIVDDNSSYAQLDLMLNLPVDLTSTDNINTVELIPFPMYGIDVLGVYLSSEVSPNLSRTGTTWVPLNKNDNYLNDPEAVGSLPPGAWSGDEILSSAPLSFVIPNEKATAIRITLRQNSAYNTTKNGVTPKAIYSYGLSHLDVRYDRFEESGKVIFKLEPKDAETISSIDSVTPYIYNVEQAALNNVFSYRVIWETSNDSGTYTLTSVPSSSKAWLEVTLVKDSEGNFPVLNGFKITYS
jgi:hypothetical protein